MVKASRTAASGFLALLALAGCGGSSDAGDETTSTTFDIESYGDGIVGSESWFADATELYQRLAVEREIGHGVELFRLDERDMLAVCRAEATALAEIQVGARINDIAPIVQLEIRLLSVEVLCPEYLPFYEGLRPAVRALPESGLES